MGDQFSDRDSPLSTGHEPAAQSPMGILRWSGFVLGLVAVVAAVAAVMPSNDKLQLREGESAQSVRLLESPGGTVAVVPANALCGNAQLDEGEACDDGNLSSSDKCLANCKLQSCGDGFIHVGFEQCDDGNADNTDSCLASCRSARCGDGLVQLDVESCDDGNADNTDACLATCETASCGDGFTQVDVESCDDGNADNTDSCLATCETASCGDGFTQIDLESCDDGNAVNTDACLATCETAPAELPELSTQAENLDLANFSLQLGAFTSLANAEEFMEAAAQVVPGVRVGRTERNGKTLYRVVLGHYPTAGQAEVIQHTLAMAGMGSLLKVRR